jgi:hypothetical protein
MTELDIQGYKVLVDDEDVERINTRKWYFNKAEFNKNGLSYFIANGSRKGGQKNLTASLHRFIMKCTKHGGVVIDHIDRNTLNNQKSNLRRCTHKENMRNRGAQRTNSSGYKGVPHCMEHNNYCMSINTDDGLKFDGYYDNPETPARRYDMAAIYYHKEFAATNFPRGEDVC